VRPLCASPRPATFPRAVVVYGVEKQGQAAANAQQLVAPQRLRRRSLTGGRLRVVSSPVVGRRAGELECFYLLRNS
jgi:hypothetical protein